MHKEVSEYELNSDMCSNSPNSLSIHLAVIKHLCKMGEYGGDLDHVPALTGLALSVFVSLCK